MPKVTWTGDASGAERANEAVAKGVKKIKDEGAGAVKSMAQLNREAQRIKEAVDPQERYNRKLAEAIAHQKAGRLTTEQLAAQTKKLQQELAAAGKSATEAVGPRFTSSMLGAISVVGAATTAVSFLKSAFGDVEQAAQAAADSVVSSLGSIGELQQLGPEGFSKGLGIARQLVRTGAVSPQNKSQAADIATDLINSGFGDEDLQFIVQELGASKVVRPENLVTVGGNLRKLQRLFGETDLASVTAQSLNAANETQANLAQTTREVVKFSTLAAGSGVTLEEALAAFEVSEQRSASPEAAAENLKSLFSQVKRRGLASGDLQGTLANIQSKIKPGGNAFDVLGDANAVIGFEQLTQRGGFEQLTRREAEIGGSSFAPINLLGTDPVIGAANVKTIEEGRLADTVEQVFATKEELFDAARAARKNRQIKNGVPVVLRALDDASQGARDLFGLEDWTIREAVEGQKDLPSLSNESLQQMQDYLERIARASEETRNTQKSKATTRSE